MLGRSRRAWLAAGSCAAAAAAGGQRGSRQARQSAVQLEGPVLCTGRASSRRRGSAGGLLIRAGVLSPHQRGSRWHARRQQSAPPAGRKATWRTCLPAAGRQEGERQAGALICSGYREASATVRAARWLARGRKAGVGTGAMRVGPALPGLPAGADLWLWQRMRAAFRPKPAVVSMRQELAATGEVLSRALVFTDAWH